MNSSFPYQMNKNTENIILIAIMVFFAAIHFFFFHGGYFGFDEIEYMKQASNLLQGKYIHDSLYSFRYAVVVPLAFLYDILGAGDLANWLLQVVILIGVSYILLRLLSKENFWIRLVALMYVIVHPMHLMYMEKPMPDLITELGFLLCFYAYFRVKYLKTASLISDTLMFLSGFLLMFLSKETFIIIYPFFLFLFIKDIYKKEVLKFWKYVITGLFLIICIYFISYYLFLGNALVRIDAIFTNRYISACTYDLQPLHVLIERITYKCWLEMIRNGYLLPLGFSFVMFFRRKLIDKVQLFYLFSWWALLLLANFMTISYSSYVPLCDDTRHFLFIVPVGIMVWAWGWNNLQSFNLKERICIIFIWSLQLGLSVYFKYEHTWSLFLLLIIAVAGKHFIKNKIVTIIIACFGLLAIYIQNAFYNYSTNHYGQKELIEKVLEDGDSPKYIMTDAANASIGNFNAGFDDRFHFLEFKEFDASKIKERNYYIILNGMTAYLSGNDWNKMPDIAKTAQDSLPIFYKNRAGMVFKIHTKE